MNKYVSYFTIYQYFILQLFYGIKNNQSNNKSEDCTNKIRMIINEIYDLYNNNIKYNFTIT